MCLSMNFSMSRKQAIAFYRRHENKMKQNYLCIFVDGQHQMQTCHSSKLPLIPWLNDHNLDPYLLRITDAEEGKKCRFRKLQLINGNNKNEYFQPTTPKYYMIL